MGSEVTSVKPGDHVVIATLASCGTCRACSTGHPTWCVKTLGNVSQPFTFKGEPASNFAGTSVFTEQTVVKEVQAVKISQGRSHDLGLPHRLRRPDRGRARCSTGPRCSAGETAAVFGVGGVGLNVIQGLRIAGASRIIAVDTLASKEALARQFGATHFVDASATDAVAAIRELVPPGPDRVSGALGWTGGVNWSFDCVGHPAVLRNALDVLDWGGNALAIGIPPQGTEVSVDVNALAYVDRGLLGCRYGSARPHHDIPLMVELYLSGQLMLDELVTEQRPLEGFREIVEDMEAGKLARGVLTFSRDPAATSSGRPAVGASAGGPVTVVPDMTVRQIEGEFETVVERAARRGGDQRRRRGVRRAGHAGVARGAR